MSNIEFRISGTTTIKELGGHIAARIRVRKLGMDLLVFYRCSRFDFYYSQLLGEYWTRPEFKIRNSDNSAEKM